MRKRLILLTTSFIVAAALFFYWMNVHQTQAAFPKDSTFTATSGDQIKLDRLAPKVRFLSFIYLQCPDVCPQTTADMEWIRDKLVEDGLFNQQVEFLTITFDPANDSLADLKQYGDHFRINETDGWLMLHGSVADTKKLTDEFGFYYKDAGDSKVHTNATFLLDENNRVIKQFGMGDIGFDREDVYREIKKTVE